MLDLDKLLAGNKKVKVEGQEYEISTAITVKEALAFQNAVSEKGEQSQEALDAMLKIVDRAFRRANPELDILEKITTSQALQVFLYIFGTDSSEKSEKKTE